MLFFSLNYCFAAVVLIATNEVEYIILEFDGNDDDTRKVGCTYNIGGVE